MPVSSEARTQVTEQVQPGSVRSHQRFYTLDALRGLAAMAVVAYHCVIKFRFPHCLFHGDSAVDFFFVLSGFVIAYAHEQKLRSRTTGFLNFFFLRVVRLWPMIILGTLLGVFAILIPQDPLYGAPKQTITEAAIFSVFLLPFFLLPQGPYALNGVFWSLLDEIIVNVLYARFFVYIRDRLLLAFACISSVILLFYAVYAGNMHFGFRTPDEIVPTFLRAFVPYLLGVVVFRIWNSGIRPRSIDPIWLIILLAIPVFAPQGQAILRVPLGITFMCLIFPMMVWFGAEAKHRYTKVFAALGDLSYPLYAIHLPLLMMITPFIANVGLAEKVILTLVIPLMLAPLAWLVHRYIDVTVRSYVSKFVRRHFPIAWLTRFKEKY